MRWAKFKNMKTYKVLDLVYTEEEGQGCFTGTYEECFDFMTEQPMAFAYKIVPLTEEEKAWANEA